MSEAVPALEGSTLHQLLSEDENHLLDVIDELRNQGVGKLLGEEGLPQLIVCGDQSSGKSSVLEALTRVRFPTKSSVCTTFPTELRLRRDRNSRISCSIRPGASRQTAEEKERLARFQEAFDSPEKFPELITAARSCMSGSSDGSAAAFFDDVLEVEIVGPKLVPLTIVDLPGIIHYQYASAGDRDIKLVNELIESYMRKSNSIILAIVSAHNELENQSVLNQIRRIVPDGSRTLGIITKPDELPSGSEKEEVYLDYTRRNTGKFQYGWHVVRNRAYAEQASTFDERDAKEQAFFRSSRWNSIPRREVGLGVDSLREKLSKMLLDHITTRLPSIVDRLEVDLFRSEIELGKLGEARSTPRELQNYLSDISDDFVEVTNDALGGRYHRKSFFGNPRSVEGQQKHLRARIRNLNDDFAAKMLKYGHRWHIIGDSKSFDDLQASEHQIHPEIITRAAFLKDHVDVLAHWERGNELPGMSNPLLVGSLFRQQAEPWEGIASNHLLKTWKIVREFLETLLGHLTDERTGNQLLVHVVYPAMDARHHSVKKKLEELLIPFTDHEPLNIDPQFARRMFASREERIARSGADTSGTDPNSKSNAPLPLVYTVTTDDKFGSLETYNFMQAYYETAILIFINNVASLAVEQCLLAGLAKIFSSATIRDMDDEKVRLIASESRDTFSERERLTERVAVLRKGIQTIRGINPGKWPTRSTTKATSNVTPTNNTSQPSSTATKKKTYSVLDSANKSVGSKPRFSFGRPPSPTPTSLIGSSEKSSASKTSSTLEPSSLFSTLAISPAGQKSPVFGAQAKGSPEPRKSTGLFTSTSSRATTPTPVGKSDQATSSFGGFGGFGSSSTPARTPTPGGLFGSTTSSGGTGLFGGASSTGVSGGFGSSTSGVKTFGSSSPIGDSSDAKKPEDTKGTQTTFTLHREREWPGTSEYQCITFCEPWQHSSFEELRLKDYVDTGRWKRD